MKKKTILLCILLALMAMSLAACATTPKKLSAPEISLDGDTVSWNVVENAVSYDVYVGGSLYLNVTETQCVLSLAEGTYVVAVKANAEEGSSAYLSSDLSKSVQYTAARPEVQQQPLATPRLTVEGNVLSWTAVEHAASYDVYVDETPVHNVTATQYTFEDTLTAGKHTVSVVARATADDEIYVDSEKAVAEYTAAKVFSRLQKTSDIEIKKYWLDELPQTPDLTGLQISAQYLNAAEETLALNDAALQMKTLSVDEKEAIDWNVRAGTYRAVFTYVGQNGVKSSVYAEFTVAERTKDDVAECDVLFDEYAEEGTYKIADTVVTAAVTSSGKALTVTTDNGVSFVPSSALSKGENFLRVETTSGDRFVNVVVVRYIDSAEDFANIVNDMDAYYILRANLDFSDVNAVYAKPIGAAPLVGRGHDYYLDLTGNGAEGTAEDGWPLGKTGKSFNGTFDGNGFVLSGFVFATEQPPYYPAALGNALFGYIGKTGKVCNFTLRDAHLSGGKYTSFIAGVNCGVIENVAIEASCTLFDHYAAPSVASSYNFGEVKNVVYLGETVLVGEERIERVPPVARGEQENTEYAGVRCYVGDTSDLTSVFDAYSAEKGGWLYVAGVGTVYANETYQNVLSCDDVWYVGKTASLRFYQKNVDENLLLWTWGVAGFNDGVKNGTVVRKTDYDAATYTYTLTFGDDAAAILTGGETFTLGVRTQGGTYFLLHITVGQPYIEEWTCEEIIAIEGADLPETEFTFTYSDGHTETLTPQSLSGYDKNGTVGEKQTVTFAFSNGKEVQKDIVLRQKSVTGVEIASGTHKTVFEVGDAFEYAGLVLTVRYDNGTSENVDATSESVQVDDSRCNMSLSGVYTVTVFYGGKSCTYTVSVNDKQVKSIALQGTPKAEYLYGDVVLQADIADVVVVVTYESESGDGETANVTLELSMLQYDFRQTGSVDVTVTFGEKQTSYAVIVRDYALSLQAEVQQAKQVTAFDGTIDFVAAATFTLTMASGGTQAVTEGVSASETTGCGKKTVTFSYVAEKATLETSADFDVWYTVTTADEFVRIAENLKGYYLLENDVTFTESQSVTIGQAPIRQRNADGLTLLGKAEEGYTVLVEGVSFDGKFDGQGYTLYNFLSYGHPTGWSPTACGLSPFGYVGETGYVGNFTVSGFLAWSSAYTGYVAAYNEGIIENVVIDNTNETQHYARDGIINDNFAAAIASYNYGTVRNCLYFTNPTALYKKIEVLFNFNYNEEGVTGCYMDPQADYRVRVYLGDEGYTEDTSRLQTLSALVCSAVSVTAEDIDGYSFNATLSTLSGTVLSDGSLELCLYYDKVYLLSVSGEKISYGIDYDGTQDDETLQSAVSVAVTAALRSGLTFIVDGTSVDADEVVCETDDAVLTAGAVSVRFSYGKYSAVKTIDIWFVIDNADKWSLMNKNLQGYYLLANDVTFTESQSVTIGQAPIRQRNADGVTVLGKAEEGYTVLVEGVSFDGKFDGQGHTLYKFLSYGHPDAGTWTPNDCGLSPFGYIGETGYVGNFTVSGFLVWSTGYTGYVAAYNEGTIENVYVDNTNNMQSYFGYEYVAALTFTNNGTVRNCVFMTGNNTYVVCNKLIGDGDGSITACYMDATSDITETLNAATESTWNGQYGAYASAGWTWKYIEGTGTVLAAKD